MIRWFTLIRFFAPTLIRSVIFSLTLVIFLVLMALDLWVVISAMQALSFSKVLMFPQASVLEAALIGWANVALVFFFQYAHYHAEDRHSEPYGSILERNLLPTAQLGASISCFIAAMALMIMTGSGVNRFLQGLFVGLFMYLSPLYMTVFYQLSNEGPGITIDTHNYDD